MRYPDIFADVFTELASQPPKKKSKGDEDSKAGSSSGKKAVSSSHSQSIDSLYNTIHRSHNS